MSAGPGGSLALVDHHCHGVVNRRLDRESFENLITEGFSPAGSGTSHFDSPLGFVIRALCAPVLDLEPHVDADDYLQRRAALAGEADRRLLVEAGLEALLVDTGYRTTELLDTPAMGALADCPAYEVVRLEAVAEQVGRAGPAAQAYPDAYVTALEEAARDAVGLKSVVAYRGGLAVDWSPPSRTDVIAAAGSWLAACEQSPDARLVDPVLLRHGLWSAAELARGKLPVQFHTGYGDPDVTLHQANPALLTDLIRAWERLDVTIVLLHCYPYQREAGYLAAVFPHVYFDVGLALNYTGPSAAAVLAEALELAPFGKQLFSSDAFGLAEFYYLGAVQFRRALDATLQRWVGAGDCSAADAERVAHLIGAGNARRIYRLPAHG